MSFPENLCEVRWKDTEIWDTTILPVVWLLGSEAEHLLKPFVSNSGFQAKKYFSHTGVR